MTKSWFLAAPRIIAGHLAADDERAVFLSALSRLAFAHEGDLPACCASALPA